MFVVNFDPAIVRLGFVEIRWYSLAYILGFIAAYKMAVHFASRYKLIDKIHIENFLNWAVLSVILGGRLGYVFFYNLGFYLNHPTEIIKLWHGGMSFHGAVLGLLCVACIFSKINKISFLTLADLMVLGAPVGLFFGRIANFINGELWGRAVEWGFIFPNAGDLIPRHPSQLYEAFLEGFVLLLINLYLAKKNIFKYKGSLGAVFLVLYGLFRFIVEFFREPDSQIGLFFGIVTMGQILCFLMIISGLVFLLAKYKSFNSNQSPAKP